MARGREEESCLILSSPFVTLSYKNYVFVSQNKPIVPLHSINWPVCVAETDVFPVRYELNLFIFGGK
jgi:hypothetical protein